MCAGRVTEISSRVPEAKGRSRRKRGRPTHVVHGEDDEQLGAPRRLVQDLAQGVLLVEEVVGLRAKRHEGVSERLERRRGSERDASERPRGRKKGRTSQVAAV